jgi:hypothetical protein
MVEMIWCTKVGQVVAFYINPYSVFYDRTMLFAMDMTTGRKEKPDYNYKDIFKGLLGEGLFSLPQDVLKAIRWSTPNKIHHLLRKLIIQGRVETHAMGNN